MSDGNLDAVFFVKDAPTVTFEDGLFHLSFRVGAKTNIELAMSPHTFLKMRKSGGKAADAFHDGADKRIVALPKH